MRQVLLTGIDGMNPLGFFAALGVLRTLEDCSQGGLHPRLSWVNEGYWRPVISGIGSIDEIAEKIWGDLETWKTEPALQLAYSKTGKRMKRGKPGSVQDLKPAPHIQRAFYKEGVESALEGSARTARVIAAFGSEVAVDNNENIKPSALHFTAGQQQFLKMVNQIAAGVNLEDIRQALVGPWTYDSTLPSLSWTGTGARMWALRASNPSKDKRGSCPGAEWLAFVGMSFFPCAPQAAANGRRTRVETTSVHGGWKNSAFTWPLWSPPASATAVASLLRTSKLAKMPPDARRARGIETVLKADIARSDQGGYGSFSPAQVI